MLFKLSQCGQSGNRGSVAASGREEYEHGNRNNFPSILKDQLSLFRPASRNWCRRFIHLKLRTIKGASYVHTCSWTVFRKQIEWIYRNGRLKPKMATPCNKCLNRDLTNAFYVGDLIKSMFIENPRDNSTNHVLLAKMRFRCPILMMPNTSFQQEDEW